MMQLETRTMDLRELVERISERSLLLPGFQRDFDWAPSSVRSLLTTILLGWPSGSLLFAAYDEEKDDLALRPFVGAGGPTARRGYSVLDGQQRLTSLFMALTGAGPNRYALSFRGLSSANLVSREALEDAIRIIPTQEWESQLETPIRQYRAGLIPFTVLSAASDFFKWRAEATATWDDGERDRDLLTEVFRAFLPRISDYRYPVTVVGGDVQAQTLASIFEVTNRSGLRLTTFDLMVARTSTRDWSMREMWQDARDEYNLIDSWLGDDGTPLLRAIALAAVGDVRQSAILDLKTSIVQAHWATAVPATVSAIEFLVNKCGAASPDFLPYDVMLPALTAIYMTSPDFRPSRQRAILKWVFVTGLTSRYDAASNSRVARDFAELLDGEFNGTLSATDLGGLNTATRRANSALWRTFLCVLNLRLRTEGNEIDEPLARSVFGRTSEYEPEESPHLRALSYALFPRGMRASAAREWLSGSPDALEAQMLPADLSRPRSRSEIELLFAERASKTFRYVNQLLGEP